MSGLAKRSFSLSGHATSVALEPQFWSHLDEAARQSGVSMAGLMGQIDAARGDRPLASACRLHVLSRLEARIDTLGTSGTA